MASSNENTGPAPRTPPSSPATGSIAPWVARSIAWMVRGARRVPYRGVAKNNAWWVTRAAGINLKRLLTLGLTLEEGNEHSDSPEERTATCQ